MIFKRKGADVEPALVESLAGQLQIEPKLAEVLIARGHRDAQSVTKFLNPKDQPLHDPMALDGMREAVSRIRRAIEQRETVVIYSDYDADGVCSAAMLYLYLNQFGLEPVVYLPSRHSQGYGLHIEAIEMLAETYQPDLILTCDCGISAYREVEHALDLGMDVIVTDHHEPPEELPDCIRINPKLSPQYPCRDLCGAGVVLKVLQALAGDAAMQYVDICAIATIADLVPLLDENRTIAALGLEKLNTNPVEGLKMFLNDLGIEKVTSGDIAFKISPRINAAGRIGDSMRALKIIIGTDNPETAYTMNELTVDNDKRKELCDRIYEEACRLITRDNLLTRRAIVLKDDRWEKGIIGIVCARIAGEFRRPTFLLAKSNDVYKATARSIEGINLYELLTAHAGYFVEYGGHAQAAGFSIHPEQVEPFTAAVNEYIGEHYPDEYFLPAQGFDADIDKAGMTMALAGQIEHLEPFGQNNPKPVFKLEAGKLKVSHMRNPEHLNVTMPDGAAMVAFKQAEFKEILQADTPKDLLVELDVNTFRGKESLKVNIRAVAGRVLSDKISPDLGDCQRVAQFAYAEKPAEYTVYTRLADVIPDNIYGTYVIADTMESYLSFVAQCKDKFFLNEYFCGTPDNDYNRLILSPKFPVDLKFYDRVVFLDRPLTEGYIAYVAGMGCDKVFVPDIAPKFPVLDTSRAEFGRYFNLIRDNQHISAPDFYAYADALRAHNDITRAQLLFTVLVFRELGIVKVRTKPYTIQIDRQVKSDLSNSSLYRRFAEHKDG